MSFAEIVRNAVADIRDQAKMEGLCCGFDILRTVTARNECQMRLERLVKWASSRYGVVGF